jgi:hypothetical protein
MSAADGVLVGRFERRLSDTGGREPQGREKREPWRRGASPGHEARGPKRFRKRQADRSDVRQEFARFIKSPIRFSSLGQADGRQPFMPQEYLTMPVLESYPFGFADCEAEAAAFRRAR